MSDYDQELTEALKENGKFDVTKADQMRAQTITKFNAGLRKIERIMWFWLCGFAVLLSYAIVRYFFAVGTKEIILFAFLAFAALEAQTLIKLWYWILNNKIGVLKEIKMLRIEMEHGIAGTEGAPEYRHEILQPTKTTPGCSKFERRIWLAVIIVLCCAASVLGNAYFSVPFLTRPNMYTKSVVTLGADGMVDVDTEIKLAYLGRTPRTSDSLNAPADMDIRWYDAAGRELPREIKTKNDRNYYTFRFLDPIMPGEWAVYRLVSKSKAQYDSGQDLWIYTGDWTYWQNAQFCETVRLPSHAEIVSTDPETTPYRGDDGSSVLSFEGRRGRNKRFRYSIKYRIPGSQE